jgi:hypothetical protein
MKELKRPVGGMLAIPFSVGGGIHAPKAVIVTDYVAATSASP